MSESDEAFGFPVQGKLNMPSGFLFLTPDSSLEIIEGSFAKQQTR